MTEAGSTPAGPIVPSGYERERAFLAEQAEHRSLVVFVGAGASVDAGLPSWKKLVVPLAKELGVDESTDLLDISQWYADAYGRTALLEHVKTELAAVRDPGDLHSALAGIPAPVFLTTNYDLLVEKAIGKAQGAPADVVIEDGHVGLIDEARRTSLVKLHGCLTLPATIVLTRDDYEAYADTHRAMIAFLQSLLATRTFLFVGFSLIDPNFRAIYSTIARALGPYQRQAYLIEGAKRSPPLVGYWRQKGIVTLELDGFAQVTALVRDIAKAAGEGRSAISTARALSNAEPSISAIKTLVCQLEALQGTLALVIAQARGIDLLPAADAPPVEAPDQKAQKDVERKRVLRHEAQSLLRLATAVDGVAPLQDPSSWVSLGDLLYEQGDASGAIRAYQASMRPIAEGEPLPTETIRRVRGNLARAYTHAGHHGRAEWLLRRCVYNEDIAEMNGDIDRLSVYRHLDIASLRQRPGDAGELGHAITRRAERLRADGHPSEALSILREVRYLLEPLLGIQYRLEDPPSENLFRSAVVQPAAQGLRWTGGLRRGGAHAQHFHPKAWALNVLGKGYRLSAELSLDLARSDVPTFCERAGRYLHCATNLAPLMPYPYAHRLHLLSNPRIDPTYRGGLIPDLKADMDKLALNPDPDAQAMLARFRADFPDAVVWPKV